MNTTFGEIIRKQWKISGMSQRELASKLHMSLRNLQSLFERDDFPISQLMEISKELNKDFVSEYLEYRNYPLQKIISNIPASDSEVLYQKSTPTNQMSIQLTIRGDYTILAKNFSDIISKIKRETESYGLIIE